MDSNRYIYSSFRSLGLSLVLLLTISCSRQNEPITQAPGDSPSDSIRLGMNLNESGRFEPPSWCSVKETPDEVCFRCERQDGVIKIPYEQCLTPGPSFSTSSNCTFANGLTKQITCSGTRSGEAFRMDTSLAKERLSAALPAFLVGLDLIVRHTYSEQSDAARLTSDLSSFWSSRIASVVHAENLNGVADDLVALAKRHLKNPLSEDQAQYLRETTITALNQLHKELTGQKDYNLSRVILRGLALARSIPDSTLGDASVSLTGMSLANMVSADSSNKLQGAFNSLNPSTIGMSSFEDFLAELSGAQN